LILTQSAVSALRLRHRTKASTIAFFTASRVASCVGYHCSELFKPSGVSFAHRHLSLHGAWLARAARVRGQDQGDQPVLTSALFVS
jgi:hypothetical protein